MGYNKCDDNLNNPNTPLTIDEPELTNSKQIATIDFVESEATGEISYLKN